ncbi:hypothetical protein SAMN05216327_12339 [Dyadobacter sp. SG02]|uniref:hypothetical protein n=1 Tax=Dyadobacter sp. SG02 TaxID=1855291 RepID=UPI0008D373F4|nr:hypothetical protein [Dyadobacter sp. SG02]SEJ83894.1 hypothetical protein SAMN05216327_12339 [Dyadobacter sp. SG02]
MNDASHISLSNMLYSSVDKKQRGNEQFVSDHALGYIISGETHFLDQHGKWVVKEDSIGLARRNQLVKSLKVPPANGECKAVNIVLDQNFLHTYAAENRIAVLAPYRGDTMISLKGDPFLKDYFQSLLPCFE